MEMAAKKRRESVERCGVGSLRSFTLAMLSKTVGVKVPCDGNVGDLLDVAAKELGVGPFFNLWDASGQILDDKSAPLPSVPTVTCVVEDASSLCPAARRVLEQPAPELELGEPRKLQKLRLGRCRSLGTFPTSEWKEDSRMADCCFIPASMNYQVGLYRVLELTIIDGRDQPMRLIGVINEGYDMRSSGYWGSFFLRPGFQDIGGISGDGDEESDWDIQDDSWYVAPSPALPRCDSALCGGESADSPLETHLAHALALALRGTTRQIEEDAEVNAIEEDAIEELADAKATELTDSASAQTTAVGGA